MLAEARLHLSAWAAAGIDVRETVRMVRAARVGLYPLSQFRMADGPDGLIFGYGAIPLRRIDEALRRLLAAVVFA